MDNILLISMFPKEEVPYAEIYLDVLKKKNVTYNIIYWNRDKNNETTYLDNEINFNLECKMGGKKIYKIFKMWKYASFIRNEIKNTEYSKIIILTTVPGIFIFDILMKKYKRNYMFDIRDFTNENNFIYYFLEKKIIYNSCYTAISSSGFKTFLPDKKEYLKVHNISNLADISEEVSNINKKDKLLIGFVGNVRYEQENELLISKLKNSLKFEMAYWGKVNKDFNIESIKKRTNAKNVSFFGKFSNEEKSIIYKKIDFINAIYGSDGLEVTTAIPNRFYDALIFKKPIITSKGTFIGELVQKYNLGISVDIINDNIEDMILYYLKNFDAEIFLKTCDNLLREYLNDQEKFKNSISDFIEM